MDPHDGFHRHEWGSITVSGPTIRKLMTIPIKLTVERIPGGMMLVPLVLAATIVTFAPGAGAFFGSFTGALFTGALPILAVFYVCIGARISLRALPRVLRKGGALLGAKILLGLAAAFFLGRLLGVEPIPTGWFAGLSTLAVVAAINDTNGGLYMSLMEQYGTPEDSAAYTVMALESGPFLTMVSLGVVGLSAFPWQTLVGAILPIAVGMILGNLDPELRTFLGNGASVMIPFFAFALGRHPQPPPRLGGRPLKASRSDSQWSSPAPSPSSSSTASSAATAPPASPPQPPRATPPPFLCWSLLPTLITPRPPHPRPSSSVPASSSAACFVPLAHGLRNARVTRRSASATSAPPATSAP